MSDLEIKATLILSIACVFTSVMHRGYLFFYDRKDKKNMALYETASYGGLVFIMLALGALFIVKLFEP